MSTIDEWADQELEIDPVELEAALRGILTRILKEIRMGNKVQATYHGSTPEREAARKAALCPICEGRPADPETRVDHRGQHWCTPCLTEFDSIDWAEVTERKLGMS